MDEDVLLPYQKAWIEDLAEVKVWEKSRRIGASYVEALASVLEAAKSKEAGGQSTYYLSYSKDMTQQFARDCAFWAKHINAAASEVEEVAIKDEDKDITVYRVRFASGFEVWCLPSVARSLRSKQGRVILDEAAFVEDLGELMKAALALLMWGGCVRILSTHNGDDNPFNELVKDVRDGKKSYSLHRTTLDNAIEQGLYRRICLVSGRPWTPEADSAWRAKLVKDYGDGADEELFCIPVRAGTRYFPTVLLDAVADATVPVVRKSCDDAFTFAGKEKREREFEKFCRSELRDILRAHQNPVYLGQDFARSGDLTCIFLDEVLPEETQATFLVVELRNVPFDQQWQTVLYLMETLPNFAGGAFDARGNGQMIAEKAAQEWPGYIHQVMISAGWYAENFPKLKGRMEDGTTTIPADPFLKDDFRVVGLQAGVPRVLERTGGPRERRHGDGAIAKLMATFAVVSDEDQGYQTYAYEAVETRNQYRESGEEEGWDD
jgi:phage FluMu gp28-like protein